MIKDLVKMISQHIIFPAVYKLNCFKKVNPKLVVMADAHKSECPPQQKLLRERLIRENYDVRDFFFDMNEIGNKKAYSKMIEFMKLYATAGCVVISDNFLPVASCKKRKETKVVQLWHGPGMFKRFGYDTNDDIPENYKGNVYSNYNLVTVSSPACVETFKRAMGINWSNGSNRMGKSAVSDVSGSGNARMSENFGISGDVVRSLGISYTDRLYDREYIAACKDRFAYEYPDARGKKIVLWAPTFRGKASDAKAIGEEIIDRLQKNDTICSDFYIIKSLHPHVKKKRLYDRSEDAKELVSGDGSYKASGESKSNYSVNMGTDELLACADILITDYSSVFFEFLIMEKPIIFFAPDFKEYVGKRGFYIDYKSLPGEIIANGSGDDDGVQELSNAIINAGSFDDDKMKFKRDEFRNMYMSSCDGKATDRILDYIIGVND